MRQLPLTYKPKTVAETAQENFLEAIQAAVLHLGLKVVAADLGVAKSTLSEAMGGNGERRWAQEWTFFVLAMLEAKHTEMCDQLALDILNAQTLSSRYEVVEIERFTPEEIATAERVFGLRKKGRAA